MQQSPYVAYPDQDYKTKESGFQKINFVYDVEKDVYICPAKQELSSNGTLHDKKKTQRASTESIQNRNCLAPAGGGL